MFIAELKRTLNDEFNYSRTENGALGYRTTGKELLDLNFAVSSLRHAPEDEIVTRFARAFFEDRLLALKWLFFARDVRAGLGERRLFRILLKNFAQEYPIVAERFIELVQEYGRFDDLLALLDGELAQKTADYLYSQLKQDEGLMKQHKPVSLLAKWMPSCNASSSETRRLGRRFCCLAGIRESEYRKRLSALRRYIDVVECQMSDRAWGSISYKSVPSRANLIYSNAFMRHDEERRTAYLDSVQKGEAQIHAGVLYPHDIVNKSLATDGKDQTVEELWKALPDLVQGDSRTIVVADGSGSMFYNDIVNSRVRPIDVAIGLAIYFAERCSGQFKDSYISFSHRPQLVDLSQGPSLYERIRIARLHNEVANTDIAAVFDLILTVALGSGMKQMDLPNNVLVISDMEFDCATNGPADARLFSTLAAKYEQYGYNLPRLIFWNVCSRTGTIPVIENGAGVALVSGFSPNVVKMVLSSKLDPYECMLETLNSERYAPVERAVLGV